MYTDEFIKQVTELFPLREDILEMAKNHEWQLGSALREIGEQKFSPERMIKLVAKERPTTIKLIATKIIGARELYELWYSGKAHVDSRTQARNILNERRATA